MTIRVAVAGATGWTGSAVVRRLLTAPEFELVAAIARQKVGTEVGGIKISASLAEAAKVPIDVLVDFTKPDSVKARTLEALGLGIRVVIGTSGLTAADFQEIESTASSNRVGVIAAGNFSITAALAKHFCLLAARHLPSWEIIDYAHAGKVDAPSGSARELAEALATVRENVLQVPIEKTFGAKQARGATIGGAQVHSVRLPGVVLAFEALFGLPDEKLTVRHDAGSSAEPYVGGTLLSVEKVMGTVGLVRGLDRLLFA